MPEKKTIADCIAMLCVAFNRDPSSATFQAYEVGMGGISDDDCRKATEQVLQQNRKFMPSPGELREIAASRGRPFDLQAQDAWQCLNKAIDHLGATKSVNFRDGAINATVRHFGGWERICGLPVSEFEKWFRKDFEQTYLLYIREGCPPGSERPLVGSIERENNRLHGLPNPATGEVYRLPGVVEVEASYQPTILALPAPEREEVELPMIEFKRPEEVAEPAPEKNQPVRMARKNDVPKSHKKDWNTRADLEFELSPEQLEQQKENQRRLKELRA